MPETIAALLLGHVLADYVFQTGHMATNKHRNGILAIHTLIVGAASWGALGFSAPGLVLTIMVLHAATDWTKAHIGGPGLMPHLLDQLAHILAILLLAPLAPEAWAKGLWAGILPAVAPAFMLFLAGFIFATRAGAFAMELLIRPMLDRDWVLRKSLKSDGLAGAGQVIGVLERALTYLAVVTGNLLGVAILVAAKSILRIGSTGKDRKHAEYVLVGTLASIGWAVMTGAGVRVLTDAMPSQPTP